MFYEEEWLIKVKDIIIKNVFCFNADDPIDKVSKEFCVKGLKQAPILDKGQVVGIIEAIDLLRCTCSSNNLGILVKEKMKKDFCKTYNDTPLDEIKNLNFDC